MIEYGRDGFSMPRPVFKLVHSFPLSWPHGWPRTPEKNRKPPKDNVTHYLVAKDYVEKEFRALGAHLVQISTNLPPNSEGEPFYEYLNRRIEQPGVAVSFIIGEQSYVMACDTWEYPKDNLRSIGVVIGHMRAAARNAAEYFLPMLLQNFAVGRELRATLPDMEDSFIKVEQTIAEPPEITEEQRIISDLDANANPKEWWSILQLDSAASLSEVEAAFRRLARHAHPDRGGDANKMRLLSQAVAHARQNLKSRPGGSFFF